MDLCFCPSIPLHGLVSNCAQRHCNAGGAVVRTEFHKRGQIMQKTVRLIVYFALRFFGLVRTLLHARVTVDKVVVGWVF